MKALLVLNAVALLAAVYLSVLQPVLTDVNVRMRYTQLDRARAINHTVLEDPSIFHPDYGFSANDRNTVPRYIAQPALDGQRLNAFLLLALAFVNVAIAVFLRKSAVPARQIRGATNIDQPHGPPTADQPDGRRPGRSVGG